MIWWFFNPSLQWQIENEVPDALVHTRAATWTTSARQTPGFNLNKRWSGSYLSWQLSEELWGATQSAFCRMTTRHVSAFSTASVFWTATLRRRWTSGSCRRRRLRRRRRRRAGALGTCRSRRSSQIFCRRSQTGKKRIMKLIGNSGDNGLAASR